ncbi:MAG: L-2-amino-thiazoline-4-carboxylic acid hydrolase [Candidatus Heimdallarchaeaceae archaeon]|jgi:hypothetical protein
MEKVPFEEAVEQVEIAMIRLALMHLSYSKVLIKELGEEKGKELILKSIIEYGNRVGKRAIEGHQDLSHYGVHRKYVYKDKEYIDARDLISLTQEDSFNYSILEIHDCILAKIFKEYNEEDLGKLYCYIDASNSMTTNPKTKAIHRKCVLCGDDYCQITIEETSEKERKDFENSNPEWKNVDPLLLD